MGTEGGRYRPERLRRDLAERLEELDAGELREGISRYARSLGSVDRESLYSALAPARIRLEEEPAPRPDLDESRAAFRAEPDPTTLHHLLLAVGDDSDEVQRVVEGEIRENLWSLEDFLPTEADLLPPPGILARLELLAGRYGDAIQRFLDADASDWSGLEHPGYPVGAFLLLASSSLSRLPDGSAIEELWRKTDRVPGAGPGQTPFSERLIRRLRRWPVSALARQRFLTLVEEAVGERTRAIARLSDTGAHLAGATAVVAVCESGFLAGEIEGSKRFLEAMLALTETNAEFHDVLRDRADASSILPHRVA